MTDFAGITTITITVPSEEHDKEHLADAARSAIDTALWYDRHEGNIGMAIVVASWDYAEDAEDEDDGEWWDVDGVDIRELVKLRELAENTPNVVLLAEHQRSRGDVAIYGPYPTAADARDAAIMKYQAGDFDPHGCYVDYKTLGV